MSGSGITMDEHEFAVAFFGTPTEDDLRASRYTLLRLHGAFAVSVLSDLLTPSQMHRYCRALESDMSATMFLRLTRRAVATMAARLAPDVAFTDAETRAAEHLGSAAFRDCGDARVYGLGLRPDSPRAPALDAGLGPFYLVQARLLLSTRLPLARIFRAMFGAKDDPHAAVWRESTVESDRPVTSSTWYFPRITAWEESDEGREAFATAALGTAA